MPISLSCSCPSRRALLGSAVAAAAAAAAATSPALAAGPAPGRIIDVHHHLMPPSYLSSQREAVEATVPPFARATFDWTPQWSLDQLDQNGGQAAILSLSAPGVWFGDGSGAPKLARDVNDYGAQVVRDHPTRFGYFASLPWPNVDASLKEIEYAFDILKVDGVVLMTSAGGRYPGEAEFSPLWQELNRRKAAVYFHPHTPGCCGATVRGLTPSAIEFPFDTTRAIASLLMGLMLSRHPDIRFIFAHGGGALPTLANRLAGAVSATNKEAAAEFRGGALAELGRLHFDTASITNPGAWAGLTELAPISQILFGTDYPYFPLQMVAGQLDQLGLSKDDLDAVKWKNARRLFPRFAV